MKKHVLSGLMLVISGLAIPYLASGDSSDNHLMTINPSIRALLPGQDRTAAFVTIHNHGARDCKLVNADSHQLPSALNFIPTFMNMAW